MERDTCELTDNISHVLTVIVFMNRIYVVGRVEQTPTSKVNKLIASKPIRTPYTGFEFCSTEPFVPRSLNW